MKIGIIGAENSHTAAIAKAINVDKLVSNFSVDYVWGETEEYAKDASTRGCIPNVVNDPKEMLGKIDALIVDHRHPKYHLKAALPFVKKGLPAFIDKPFCYRVQEGEDFLKIARKHGSSITTFSILVQQKSFLSFLKKLKTAGDILAGQTWGPCDLRSIYGGIFFYGIHQVDMALKAFGYNVQNVLVTKNGKGATGQLLYPNGRVITMHLIKDGFYGFGIGAIGSKKAVHHTLAFDENCHLTGIKMFTKMFKTKVEPKSKLEMLQPVKVLEALKRSSGSRMIEKV